ncbi:MAG: hypothetical protein M3Y65_24530 [Pseudomonadota bacterium]|nr:hypothetical protein [Pseudomonadota bacterium]
MFTKRALAPPVSALQARHMLLALCFCVSMGEVVLPLASLLMLNVLFSFLTFLWYCRDRDAHGRRRSWGRNLSVLLLPFIAIPWYLMRHQPLRGRVRGLLRFLGYLGLMVLAILAGALVAAMLSGILGIDFPPAGAM